MNIFPFRDGLIHDYSNYIQSFISIQDERIHKAVFDELKSGLLWPEPLIQLNPAYQRGGTIDDLVKAGVLHTECARIFRRGKGPESEGSPLTLYKHQEDAIHAAKKGQNYVLTSGTGSGKSLAYIIPIVDYVLRNGSGKGIQAIIVYPMNALANSQLNELKKFLHFGYPNKKGPVTFERYTGQESDEERDKIIANPPDILLTNYVMLELILTRTREKPLIKQAKGLRFLIIDELHTYRGRQGADVALLIRRAREFFESPNIQCVGTSATLASNQVGEDPRLEVSRLTTRMFGAPVHTENVIVESLRRMTREFRRDIPVDVEALKKRIEEPPIKPPLRYNDFVEDPLSRWIESTFGVSINPSTGKLERAKPRSIGGPEGAVKELADLTGLPEDKCATTIKQHLMSSYQCEREPETNMPIFAFRLHQFISRGGTPFASIGNVQNRYVTVQPQRFVPGDRNTLLFPLVFCRECGQEYYTIRIKAGEDRTHRSTTPRDFKDTLENEEGDPAYLYISKSDPWPVETDQIIQELPADWLDDPDGNHPTIKKSRKDRLPKRINLETNGVESADGVNATIVSQPFPFCLHCGVSYDLHQRKDFQKLTSMEEEGRSTATTILTLSAIQQLYISGELEPEARKLLSFTDNRQDASLQAGHFNDFVEVGLLRSALFKAVSDAGQKGIRHEDLVDKVYDALNLPLEYYASDPTVRFQALDDVKRAFKEVLGYRLYRDLKRGWRITAPNLEQCGLLRIEYRSLDDVCRAEDIWANKHPALSKASIEQRKKISQTLLDHIRRELAINEDSLSRDHQGVIQRLSSQHLKEPWAIDEGERMEYAFVVLPRPESKQDYSGFVYISGRGGFGQYLRTNLTLDGKRLKIDDTEQVIRDLFEALHVAGLVKVVREPTTKEDVPGYQLPASAIQWIPGDGKQAFHDPIRVPRAPEAGRRVNPFFINFYHSIAQQRMGIQAREHTAQVPPDERIKREDAFREGRLPILFCSPTMELGVDIADLNVVNLRNVPPTPANYAQRSGRAGRGGQPAIVFTYCSKFSPHDQYFFRRPQQMVSGVVAPPRIELGNEDLVRAHINAIWLSEAGMSLGETVKDKLDVGGEKPSLLLLPSVKADLESTITMERAQRRAANVLASMETEMAQSDWFTIHWLEDIIHQIPVQFDRACDRWRDLYRAAIAQRARQHAIIGDALRSQQDRERAERLRREAENQIRILTEAKRLWEADFNSYRYFASEGFLPGYNFPRLPLSAFIPGRRVKGDRQEFLSRPRFIAISEFGPRAIIYHEGSRYRIRRIMLPPPDRPDQEILTDSAKLCPECGYLHPQVGEEGADLCERCNQPLTETMRNLFRLQNVSAERADRISSDEEERHKIGYELKSAIRFTDMQGVPTARQARVTIDGAEWGNLTYGPAALIWRINLGWSRRANKEQLGFILDIDKGIWSRNQVDEEDTGGDDPGPRTQKVIPYVHDRRNCLIIQPKQQMSKEAMASLQAVLKTAIQVIYQLEDAELAAEPLPSTGKRNAILIYESAEGGAGVLRQIVDDADAFRTLALKALEICHFDPDTGTDLRHSPKAKEDCEAACYQCLMSYYNQIDHKLLDRQSIRDELLKLRKARVEVSARNKPRTEHLQELKRLCGSELERNWLDFLNKNELRLPTSGQKLFANCSTKPDFFYEDHSAAIYIDGPVHEFSDRHERDIQKQKCMEDCGFIVIRFKHTDDWGKIIKEYPNVFGRLK